MCAFEPEWRPVVEEFPPGHIWTEAEGLVRYGEIAEQSRAYHSRDEAKDAIRAALIAGSAAG
jgi:hypothetical protein